ncbi:MAG: hypothetical protein KDJ38_14960, partial [Gammaproteobacteria bacterium]|nr:hypothetical protein [Gammaproteobacteria bacterium]
DSESRNLTDALDNTTLLQLANAIYREALILDTLYTQLLEVHEQARSNFCTPYEGLPQLPIPMSRLTLQQLNEAKLETQRQIELLLVHEAADADSSVPKKIACLKSLRGNLEAELIRREYPL